MPSNPSLVFRQLLVSFRKLAVLSAQAFLRSALSHCAVLLGHMLMPFGFRSIIHDAPRSGAILSGIMQCRLVSVDLCQTSVDFSSRKQMLACPLQAVRRPCGLSGLHPRQTRRRPVGVAAMSQKQKLPR